MDKSERQEETDLQHLSTRKQGFVNCSFKNNSKEFSNHCCYLFPNTAQEVSITSLARKTTIMFQV